MGSDSWLRWPWLKLGAAQLWAAPNRIEVLQDVGDARHKVAFCGPAVAGRWGRPCPKTGRGRPVGLQRSGSGARTRPPSSARGRRVVGRASDRLREKADFSAKKRGGPRPFPGGAAPNDQLPPVHWRHPRATHPRRPGGLRLGAARGSRAAPNLNHGQRSSWTPREGRPRSSPPFTPARRNGSSSRPRRRKDAALLPPPARTPRPPQETPSSAPQHCAEPQRPRSDPDCE